MLSPTKKYASPVNEYRHKQKFASKAFRRIIRAVAMKQQKAKRRKGKRHPSTVEGVPGNTLKPLDFKSTREQVHATGALKRSERHPERTKARGDIEWLYVCR